MPDSWKLSLPCTRAEAEAIDAGEDLGLDPPPVLMTTEEVVDDAEHWRLDAYFEQEPDVDTVARVAALVPSAADTAPRLEKLAQQDWVTLSQSGLEPIREGRFFVHTATYAGTVPEGAVAFRIEAGQAFGTGHHETTAGCLAMLDTLAVAGKQYEKVIDLGTGTGLLAFAAVELWPMADVTATDIDPIAIEVTHENALANDVEVGPDVGEVSLLVADGARHPKIAEWAPYDLIIANILAGPLIAMAPEIARVVAPGATVVLAGLLTAQSDAVQEAYRAWGCETVQAMPRGDWTILQLRAPALPVAGGPAKKGDRDAWATDS